MSVRTIMQIMLVLSTLVLLSTPKMAAAIDPPTAGTRCEDTETNVCVSREDLEIFLAIVEDRQCLDQTKPTFEVAPITVITDKDGRVFYSGSDPSKPYELTMTWCHYSAVGEGRVRVVAALEEPATVGFRFRPKAYLGYLPLTVLVGDLKASKGMDAGVMVDVFYWQWANINVTAGFRSVGAGFGFDMTTNFGLFAGWAYGWDLPNNVLTSIYFAF